MNLGGLVLCRLSPLRATCHHFRWSIRKTWFLGLWLSVNPANSFVVHQHPLTHRSLWGLTNSRQTLPFSPHNIMSETPSSSRSKRSASSSKETEDETKELKQSVAVKKPSASKKKEPAAAKKEAAKPKSVSKKAKRNSDDDSDDASAATPKKKKAKAPPHQRITDRDPLPKLWDPSTAANGSYTFKIASWNVAGLRALLKKTPTVLPDLVQKHDLDVLCLQETKLQEAHLTDPKLKLNGGDLVEGYDAHWSCSTAKKGYAGTAVFVRKREDGAKKGSQTKLGNFFTSKNETTAREKDSTSSDNVDPEMAANLIPTEVSYEMGKEDHDVEGRIITLDFPLFTLSNLYVPNSGQKLERLTYRTDSWDKDLLAFAQKKQEDRGVPFMWLGDLNVAHKNLDCWNDGAKHLSKQAGTTPEERASFQEQLDSGFMDAFRKLHPTAQGHYSYWSQRAGNREPNKGLRLDYFVCSPDFFEDNGKVTVRDSYMVYDQNGSDHCPVVLELEIKK